jgi:thymidylate synthase (FAD)
VSDIRLTSDITVRLAQSCGNDAMVLAARQASTDFAGAARLAAAAPAEEQYGRIRHAMRLKHGSVFEHGFMTFAVHAPAFVWWEWVRHRWMAVECSDLSFNLESARYHQLEPVFWVPRPGRPMIRPPGFKPARPELEPADHPTYANVVAIFWATYQEAWGRYRSLVGDGVASEVARAVLGFGVYYSGWVSCNPRSLMAFLALRTHDPRAAVPSYPQAEIEEAARQCEEALKAGWPLVWRAFNECGRVAP